jgi:hypothetical protein
MYSSLHRIDVMAETPNGPLYVQTDHRSADEIAAEPEISTLFALTRILLARAYGAKQPGPAPTIVYAPIGEIPDFLVEVLASAGARLTVGDSTEHRELAAVDVAPATLADRAFAALAVRVQRRVGLTDPAAALKALEAETLADPPDVEDDESTYWTRVLELAAVVTEIMRARRGGHWIESERAEIPFGFECPNAGTLLPTNRAQRFIEDGEQESMFYLLSSFDDLEIPEHERPLLPSLRHAVDGTVEDMLVRPLLANATDPEIPVIAYGTDTPNAFALLRTSCTDDRDELHARAIANLANQTVEIEELDLGGFRFLAITNSFFATEKLLDQPFMRELHARLTAPLLAASVPRRGLMFVTDAAPSGDVPRAMAILAAITDKESTTSRRISKAILLVSEGAVVGHAQLGTSETEDEPTTPPPKKPGLLKRLFGKN